LADSNRVSEARRSGGRNPAVQGCGDHRLDQVDSAAAGEEVNPDYKLYHPKWHRMRMPIFWWLGELSYTKFIVRELTSLAVGYAAVILLIQIWILSRGKDAYARFLEWLQSPFALIVHTLVLLILLFHTITWLNLAPKAETWQRRGEHRGADGTARDIAGNGGRHCWLHVAGAGAR
jgi:fumarate reductase subunit C